MNYANKPYCGRCPLFQYEDIDGFGVCSISEREQRCNDRCGIAHTEITHRQAIKILRYRQKWRRGANIEMIPPYVLGQGIDAAIYQLRHK